MRSTSLLLCVSFLLFSVPSACSLSFFSHYSVVYNAFTSYFSPSPVWHPTAEDAASFLHYDRHLSGAAHIVDVRASLVRSLNNISSHWRSLARSFSLPTSPSPDATSYKYWRMIPAYVDSLIPGVPVEWSSPCFNKVKAEVTKTSSTSYTLTFTSSDTRSRDCSDSYLLATLEGLKLHTFVCLSPLKFLCDQKTEVIWDADNATAAELFDIDVKGIRAFRFQDDTVTTLEELEATLTLFAPLLTRTVSDEAASANIDFLAKYAHMNLTKRLVRKVPVDASLIHSGDFFGVLRLDGLDPMLAWAMGSVTGHTVLALWMDEPRQLYIVESTNNSSYWPVNGIQRSHYLTWLSRAANASYNVVWAPLNEQAAAAFNETAAAEYFFTQEGFDYGYYNLLWGWQDTRVDNYPCLPPDFRLCLTPHHVQVLFGFIDRALPSVGDVLFIQAWNKRLKTNGLSFAELLQYANQTAKISAELLPVEVERDDWVYQTQRFGEAAEGPAQVCCVFVCNMWKHAGVFGNLTNAFQCAEQTNIDDYALDILTRPSPKPKQCTDNNTLCQLEGDYTLELGSQYGTRTPYPHMGERCPSLAPNYSRPSDC